MPAQDKLSDADLAAVLGYVRQQFGNGASLVEAAEVAALRAQLGTRREQCTAAELR